MYAAVYTRISSDPSGRKEGVEAQERWGRAYCAERWPDLPVAVFADNNVSAAKEGAHRPGFERLHDAVRAGQVAQLWAVEQSRLTRVSREWFAFAADLVDAGVTELHTRRHGVVDLNEVVGDIMALLDAHEIRKLIKRLRDRREVIAHEGRPHGDHGFGYRNVSAEDHQRRMAWLRAQLEAKRRGEDLEQWRADNPRPPMAPLIDERGRKRIEVVQDEADALRDGATHILDGWTLTAVAKEFNRRGLIGSRGGDWTPRAVRRTYERASLAGLRVHQGEVIGKATWHEDAILDEVTWRAVNAKLDGDRSYTRRNGEQTPIPAKHPNSRKGIMRQHLLTAIAVCGVCEAPLSGHRAHERTDRSAPTRAMYRCLQSKGGRNCVSVSAEPLEDWVRDRLFDQLDKPEFLSGLTDDDHAQRRDEVVDGLRAVDRRRGEIAQRLKAGKLNLEQFDILNDGLRDEEQQLRTAMADLPPPPSTVVDLASLRDRWHLLTFDEQRQVIATCIDRVVVHRAHKGRGRVTSDDVAEHMGLSRQSINYALSGKGNLSAATRERIRKVAQDMGYERIPSTTAVVDDDRVTIEWRTANSAG